MKRSHVLMISNAEGLPYLAVKQLSSFKMHIIKRFNCFHLFQTKKKFESDKKVCEYEEFCGVVMTSQDAKMLQFNQEGKTDNTPSVIY